MSDQLTDRPDRPGVWFRDDTTDDERERGISGLMQAWFVYKGHGTNLLACWLSPTGVSHYKHVEILPPGNWSPAVPAARVAELEAEVERLRELVAGLRTLACTDDPDLAYLLEDSEIEARRLAQEQT